MKKRPIPQVGQVYNRLLPHSSPYYPAVIVTAIGTKGYGASPAVQYLPYNPATGEVSRQAMSHYLKDFLRLTVFREWFVPRLSEGDILCKNTPQPRFVKVLDVDETSCLVRDWDKKKKCFILGSQAVRHLFDQGFFREFYILSLPLHEVRPPSPAVGQVWRRNDGKARTPKWDCRKVLELGPRGLVLRNCTADANGQVTMGPTTSGSYTENFLKVHDYFCTPDPVFVPGLTLLRVVGARRNSYMVVTSYDEATKSITLATWNPTKKVVKTLKEGGQAITARVNRSFWKGFTLWKHKT